MFLNVFNSHWLESAQSYVKRQLNFPYVPGPHFGKERLREVKSRRGSRHSTIFPRVYSLVSRSVIILGFSLYIWWKRHSATFALEPD